MSLHLPEDHATERTLLCTLAAPGAEHLAAEVLPSLQEADFVDPKHLAFFRALAALVHTGSEVSPFTLRDAMGKEFARFGDFSALVEFLSGEEVARPQILADILARKRKARDLIRIGSRMATAASCEEETPEAIAEESSAALADLAISRRKGGLQSFRDISQETEASAQERATQRRERGISTGLPKLDAFTRGGFRPGQLIILAARPGVGKTSLMLQWLTRAALHGRPVALFSLEMAKEEIFNRSLSIVSGVPSALLECGNMGHQQACEVAAADRDLSDSRLLIDDQAEITIQDIRARVDRAVTRMGENLCLVAVDYLQLITSPSGSSKQNETARITEISRALKLMAKDRNVPVVVLSQLNREVEKRQGGKPQLSDLRDSGAIEQDADMVLFIHRKGTDRAGELIVAKHRNGPCGSIPMAWDGEVTTFREIERDTNGTGGIPNPMPMTDEWAGLV